jgi:pimeloyl-ACP methyl ester carboxylesterase
LLASPSSSTSSSSDDDDASSATATTTTSGKETKRRRRTAILLCPAQFCVPADYATLLDDMRARTRDDPTSEVDIVAARVAPLPRTEWIKVARQLPTRDFFDATLSAKTTLGWYFDAIETALSDLFAEAGGGDDVSVCVVGHSIGGWVARAYLGGLSGSSTSVHRLALRRVSSLITLGTPHSSPDTALVDQTRGLLREVSSHPGCSSSALSDGGRVGITCVTSSGIVGKLLTSNAEELVAAASYLPLVGRIGPDVDGDGIVPAELACMEHPAKGVVIDGCSVTGAAVRHAHVLPTPWNLADGNAPSWSLPEDIIWYGSPGVLGQWLRYIE